MVGDDRHMGLWIFPLFVMAALLGAVTVGGLAVLYYAQEVGDLEAETAAAREQLREAVDDVDRAAKRAQEDIDKQVGQARDEFSRRSPVEGPGRAGVYAVSATQPDGEVRVGSAFTVFSNQTETYLVTSYGVVATEEGAATAVEVFLPGQTVTLRIHNVDPESDMAVMVAQGGPLPVLPWRAIDQPLRRGDALYAVGVAGTDTPAVVEGTVAAISTLAIVPDLPLNAFLAGGPLIDASGAVVGLASQSYAPFGAVEGTLLYAPPIRRICERLLDCTSEDVGGLRDGATSEAPRSGDS